MQRPYHVHPRQIFEHPEVGADAWIEVEELVLAIPPVEPVVQIHDAGVGNRPKEELGLPAESFIRPRHSQRG
jgi:hypothetical protein